MSVSDYSQENFRQFADEFYRNTAQWQDTTQSSEVKSFDGFPDTSSIATSSNASATCTDNNYYHHLTQDVLADILETLPPSAEPLSADTLDCDNFARDHHRLMPVLRAMFAICLSKVLFRRKNMVNTKNEEIKQEYTMICSEAYMMISAASTELNLDESK